MRRKSVGLTEAEVVKTRTLEGAGDLPLVAEPALGSVDLAEWAQGNLATIDSLLLKHGAILFRGFGLRSAADFERTSAAMCVDLFAEYGDLPREGLSDKVYQSTPYPPDKTILFHNESSHLPSWPRKQFFMCMIKAASGGETPLLDCRRVYRHLDRDVLERFETLGVMYVRNFVPGIDVGWQEFFHTDDRDRVEQSCASEGMTCEWPAPGRLRIRYRTRAVVAHPITGEKSFFNQIQLHHPYCLDHGTRSALCDLFREDELPRNVYYGDGSPIEDHVMERIGELYWQLSVSFPWEEGDLILIENMLVSHARNPYAGPRKIVVAMGSMCHGKDL
jgi:alpha-ketoglutarate-dependent taurine dioxygenase